MISAHILGDYKCNTRNTTFSKEDLLACDVNQFTLQMNKEALHVIKLLLADKTQKLIPTHV